MKNGRCLIRLFLISTRLDAILRGRFIRPSSADAQLCVRSIAHLSRKMLWKEIVRSEEQEYLARVYFDGKPETLALVAWKCGIRAHFHES
jgi:hypothetical protein